MLSTPRVRRRRSVQRPVGSADIRELARGAMEARKAMLAQREERIEELLQEARRRGEGPDDRTYWMLVYDMEMAPTLTGRAMLLEQQVIPIPPQDLESDAALHDELWTILEALAASGVYLLNTNHLCDRDLYARLFYKILDEPTRCLPPNSGASEFIDVLHMLDVEAGGYGALLAARLLAGDCVDDGAHDCADDRADESAGESAGESTGDSAGGGSAPEDQEPMRRGPFNAAAMADRDRWLPRPGA